MSLGNEGDSAFNERMEYCTLVKWTIALKTRGFFILKGSCHFQVVMFFEKEHLIFDHEDASIVKIQQYKSLTVQ